MRRWLLLGCLWAGTAAAAETAPPANAPAVTIATAQQAGTANAFGRDIASVSRSMGQPVNVLSTRGSIENLKLMAGGKANLAIVQSDVLGFLTRSSSADSRRIASLLRVVLPLYREEIHVLARREIADMAGLNGKRIVIGEDGSGNVITSVNLLSLLGIKSSEQIRAAAPEAVVKVLTGEADAMIFVGGAPVPLFDRLQTLKTSANGKNAKLLDQVHFLRLNDPKLFRDYTTAALTPAEYPFLRQQVPTIAVVAVLVAADASSGADEATVARCDRLEKVGTAIRRNIAWLKRSGHPKWREVDFAKTLPGWPQDMCSWRDDPAAPVAAQSETVKGQAASPLHRELLDLLNRPRAVTPDAGQPALAAP